MKFFSRLFLVLLTLCAVAQAQTTTLAAQLQTVVDDPAVAASSFGISVVSLDEKDGAPVYAMNEKKLFTPASNAKLATTAAAFALLPAEALRWRTNVVTAGSIDAHGVLHGDLVILGAGDPTLSTRSYPYQPPMPLAPGVEPTPAPDPLAPLDALAAQIAQAGVRVVEGNVIGDDRFYLQDRYGSGWSWDDTIWPDGAPASALSYNDNVIGLNIDADANNAAAITQAWSPQVALYTLDNAMTTTAGAPARPGLDRAPGTAIVRTWGSFGTKGFHVHLAVDDPAKFTAMAFLEALRARGIQIKGTATAQHAFSTGTENFIDERAKPLTLARVQSTVIEAPVAGRTVLASRTSPTLREDLTLTNKVSQNLHAELALRLLGKLEADAGNLAEGTRVVRQFLSDAGIDDQEFFFYDGSGMSPNDRITPRAMTQLLRYAAAQPWGPAWRATLPIAGIDGTLRKRFADSPLKEKLWAKTGTLDETNTLSGYLIAASGKTLAFSILVNGHRPGNSAALHAIDQIVEAIAAAN